MFSAYLVKLRCFTGYSKPNILKIQTSFGSEPNYPAIDKAKPTLTKDQAPKDRRPTDNKASQILLACQIRKG